MQLGTCPEDALDSLRMAKKVFRPRGQQSHAYESSLAKGGEVYTTLLNERQGQLMVVTE